MTAPSQAGNGSRPAAPPPSPKIQAVEFALKLADVRSKVAGSKPTDVVQLIDDATVIESYIGKG